MLRIYPNDESIKFHQKKVSEIFSKINSFKTKGHELPSIVVDFIKNNQQELIGSEPAILFDISNILERKLNDIDKESTKIVMGYVYETHFQKKFGKEFLNILNIDTCVYCNRNYTLDFRSLSNARAQLDHWFPKATFPILALSFYNLIPSCSSCNHLKNNANGDDWNNALKNLTHPYLEDNSMVFSFGYQSFDNPKTIIKTFDEKSRNTVEFNKVDKIYESHSSRELKDLLDLRIKYSKNYLDILCNKTFVDLNLSTEEVYRMIFGIEIEKENFHKRPFSKFKKDIINELLNK